MYPNATPRPGSRDRNRESSRRWKTGYVICNTLERLPSIISAQALMIPSGAIPGPPQGWNCTTEESCSPLSRCSTLLSDDRNQGHPAFEIPNQLRTRAPHPLRSGPATFKFSIGGVSTIETSLASKRASATLRIACASTRLSAWSASAVWYLFICHSKAILARSAWSATRRASASSPCRFPRSSSAARCAARGTTCSPWSTGGLLTSTLSCSPITAPFASSTTLSRLRPT